MFKPFLRYLYWFLAIVLSLAFIAVAFIDKVKYYLIAKGFIPDANAIMNLQADGHWLGFEWLIGVLFLAASLLLFKSYRNRLRWQLHLGLAAFVMFNSLAIAVIVPKIGLYTQAAAVDFYREKANEDCYMETHAFKSYAQLFYGNRKQSHFINPDQKKYVRKQLDLMVSEGHSRAASYSTAYTLWLENGNVDKTTYIVVKTIDKNQVTPKGHFKHLYDKNGFSFFVRQAGSTVK